MTISEPPDHLDVPPLGDDDINPTGQEWPEPQLLDDRLYPVPRLEPAMLPESIQAYGEDIAHRMNCPLSMVAAPLLVALSSVIGRRCQVRPKQRDNWTVTPNLWGVVVGRPGSKKSPAMNMAIEPLKMLEDRAHKGAGEDGHQKRYTVTDSTPEKLIEIMRDNPQGVALTRDELAGLFMQCRKQGREGERQQLLESWSGDMSHTTDRIGRGTVYAPVVCLAIIGTIQPDVLARHVRAAVHGGDDNDGLLSRFQLMVHPDPCPTAYVDELPSDEARERVVTIFERLDGITEDDIGRDDQDSASPPFLRFDADAQELAVEYFMSLDSLIADPGEDNAIRAHFSKYHSLMPSLALIFELANWVANPNAEPLSAISTDSARLACSWCEFLAKHARRVYGLATMGPESPGPLLARKILSGALGREFTRRDVDRKQWRGLQNKALDKALETLEEWSWIRKAKHRRGPGRKAKKYQVNASLNIGGSR